ncbi:MAG: alkaline phosphatase family protein [Bacteroidales bacterium]
MKNTILAIIMITLTLGGFNTKAQQSSTPRLIIVATVDNMRPDYVNRYWDNFSEGGFKRCFNQGAVLTKVIYNQLKQAPETNIPTLLTGSYTRENGIVGKKWYDHISNCEVDAVYGKLTSSEIPSPSPENLRSFTIGDGMKLVLGEDVKVFGVGANEYSAILGAGRTANAAYWIKNSTEGFTSAPYYKEVDTEMMETFNRNTFVPNSDKYTWTTSLDASYYKSSNDDKSELEHGFSDKRNTFPYSISKYRESDKLFIRKTPLANEMLREFAIRLISTQRLGKDNTADFLSISFSSMDDANPWFGGRSMEMEDLYIKLDKDIESLLLSLDREVGKNNYLFILMPSTSSSILPEEYKALNLPGNYMDMERSKVLLKAFLNHRFGDGNWIHNFDDNQVILNRTEIEKKEINLAVIQTQAAQFLTDFQGIRSAYSANTLNNGEIKDTRFQNSYFQSRTPDILFDLYESYMPEYSDKISNYVHDSKVTGVILGGKIKAQRYNKKVNAIDIVPTIWQILNIEAPFSYDGTAIEGLTN